MATQKFLVELIKPSHYDDDGYLIQWWRGFIPSNSLSCLYGLVLDASAEQVLGPEVEIEVRAWDETNITVPIEKIIRRFKRNGNHGLVCLVGVQTNQFARALDIAAAMRAAGIQVAIGGFHVSGCLAMLPELPAELQAALDLGITLFAGEAEGRLGALFQAAHNRQLKPIYNFMADLPGLASQPLPFLPQRYVRRYAGMLGCFDAGRGCPFSCSFCTIINVQGRKSRYRGADDVEKLIRASYGQGVRSFFITDDDFARNRNWEAILDRIIELKRNERMKINIIMQVDTASHKIPNFIAKAAAAGCKKVFIGLENINPDSLKGASKGQNHVTEYRKMLQAWRGAKVLTYAGYILGFPNDTAESIARDIGVIQRELPIDIMEFFMLTPLPGSKDHQQLQASGVWMDPDTNRYDSEHAVTAHPLMSARQWEAIYKQAWHLYYSWPHIETLLRRAKATGIRTSRIAAMVLYFYASHAFEGVHPLQAGLLRRKCRRQRRPGMPLENPLLFHARRIKEAAVTYARGLRFFWKISRLRRRIERDPEAGNYRDIAIQPAGADPGLALELYDDARARPAVADARAV